MSWRLAAGASAEMPPSSDGAPASAAGLPGSLAGSWPPVPPASVALLAACPLVLELHAAVTVSRAPTAVIVRAQLTNERSPSLNRHFRGFIDPASHAREPAQVQLPAHVSIQTSSRHLPSARR